MHFYQTVPQKLTKPYTLSSIEPTVCSFAYREPVTPNRTSNQCSDLPCVSDSYLSNVQYIKVFDILHFENFPTKKTHWHNYLQGFFDRLMKFALWNSFLSNTHLVVPDKSIMIEFLTEITSELIEKPHFSNWYVHATSLSICIFCVDWLFSFSTYIVLSQSSTTAWPSECEHIGLSKICHYFKPHGLIILQHAF